MIGSSTPIPMMTSRLAFSSICDNGTMIRRHQQYINVGRSRRSRFSTRNIVWVGPRSSLALSISHGPNCSKLTIPSSANVIPGNAGLRNFFGNFGKFLGTFGRIGVQYYSRRTRTSNIKKIFQQMQPSRWHGIIIWKNRSPLYGVGFPDLSKLFRVKR
jgi:hypothetical protein